MTAHFSPPCGAGVAGRVGDLRLCRRLPIAKNKTQATSSSPGDYIAAIADDSRRRDCEDLMARASKHPAALCGSSIVGFGVHKYRLTGGKHGEICAVGFSSRKGDISIYGVAGNLKALQLLKKLGRHKPGTGCLHVRSLTDVDLRILEKLVSQAIAAKRES